MTRTGCPVAFDHNSISDPIAIYAQLRSAARVSWSESNGGYWVVTGYGEVAEVLKHPEIFSSALTQDADGDPQGGIFIPAEKALVPMKPTEVDPPEWRDYRMFVARAFSPGSVEELRPMIIDMATKYIDQVIEAGQCDMVDDIAGPIPASVMIRMLGLDEDEWAFWAEPFHNALGYPPGTPEFESALVGLQDIVDRIRALVRERRDPSETDLISQVVASEIRGEPISEEDAVALVYTLFSGGVDTTTSFLSTAFSYLGRNKAAKEFLIADPSKINLAIEELVRWASPVQALGRTVMSETTLVGQDMKPGERLLLAYASANRDEGVFDEPNKPVLDRYPNQHLAWGRGIHKCVGAHLARTTSEIAIQEVLRRMPDFVIDETAAQYPNIGIVNGWVRMPATFTPGSPVVRAVT
jgi:cytochrome P450